MEKPVYPAESSSLPSDIDVAVIGAGAAGIGAARHLLSSGLSVVVLEARPRIGGRALTVLLKGHPIDLGAHWLHEGPINPLVKLGHDRREPLRRAPQDGHLFIRGRPGTPGEQASLGRAFGLAERAIRLAMRDPVDRPVAAALPSMGSYGPRVAAIHGLVSGRPLREVSLHDVPNMDYADNFFISGGLGAYLARLGRGLPVRLDTPVHAIDWAGQGVRIETAAGTLRARAAIVTAPMAVLQRDGIRFAPALPAHMRAAIHGFRQGVYEHVVLHWPDSPFRGADRLASLFGSRRTPPGLLTRIDDGPFHFFELDQPAAALLDGRDAYAPGRFARDILAEHFGHRAIRNLTVCRSTHWRHDPWSRASWAVVSPGYRSNRDILKEPVCGRIWFAGEALSRAQWGTVGGAWEEGERAAADIAARLQPLSGANGRS